MNKFFITVDYEAENISTAICILFANFGLIIVQAIGLGWLFGLGLKLAGF